MIKQILSQNSHWQINKNFALKFGLECALIISDLVDKKTYFENRDELEDGEWFYNTSENIEADTGLSYHKQRTALKKLVEHGFLEIKKQGMPQRQFFKINEQNLSDFFIGKDLKKREQDFKKIKNKTSKNLNYCIEKISEQDFKKFKVNNNKVNNNKTNKNKEKKEKGFFSISAELQKNDFLDFFIEFFSVPNTRQNKEKVLREFFNEFFHEKNKLELIEKFKTEFYAYVKYKQITNEHIHRFDSYIATWQNQSYSELLRKQEQKQSNGKQSDNYIGGRQTKEEFEQNLNEWFDSKT